jgi:hypothetical protein
LAGPRNLASPGRHFKTCLGLIAVLRSGGSNISNYGYSVNALGQRETVTTSGTAMAAPATTRWGYDALGQIVSEDFANNQSANPRDRGYAYDLIGNRENSLFSVSFRNAINSCPNVTNCRRRVCPRGRVRRC